VREYIMSRKLSVAHGSVLCGPRGHVLENPYRDTGGDKMALRFRKSKKLGKYGRINLSKSGVGFSFGVPGFRIGISPKGKVRRTIGIPGTGIYDVEEVGPAKPKKANRVCHKCNRKVGKRDSFCRYCGVKLQ
jgi:hypothetical protein